MLCPKRKKKDGSLEEPNEFKLNSIRNDPDKLATIRKRLSDVAWLIRLLCQNIGTRANQTRERCSDKGFLSLSTMDYLELLDASSRMVRPDKAGFTPSDVAPIFERLKLDPDYWRLQIQDFGRLFSNMAGEPKHDRWCCDQALCQRCEAHQEGIRETCFAIATDGRR